MYLRRLIVAFLGVLLWATSTAQVTITRGADLSVDATADGRLAIDLLGDLWIVPGGGGDARQLTHNLKTAQRPRWSPDATKLVYEANVDGQQAIWIHDLGGAATTRLSAETGLDLYPAWHPSGKRIVYSSSQSGGRFDLWEVDIATGLRWKLSDRPGDKTHPAWSSDGRDLVYVLYDGQHWSLILRRYGAAEEVLLRSASKLSAPAWRPDGSLIMVFRERAAGVSLDMVILSDPRLIRPFASNENFIMTPVSWLDRQRMVYSAGDGIRQRLFDSWYSRPLEFRATVQPEPQHRAPRERPEFLWPNEADGELVVHASRLFDGLNPGYQQDRDIVIRGGRIIAVEKHAERAGKIVINMGDLTILPGFVDADAHLAEGIQASHGPDLLTNGITTVVGRHPGIEGLNALWSGKEVPGPRLLSADQWPVGLLSRPELDVTGAVIGSRATGLQSGAALGSEFRILAAAGLTPEQSLRAVGVNAAAALLADPYLGRIATGAAADLVFVDGDPLTRIEDALNVVAVIRNGRFYSVSGLIDRAKAAETVE